MNIKITVQLSVATVLVAFNGYSESLTDGLVAFYPFNGNGNDASGNGKTASVVNSTFAADRLGKLNSSVHLNGIDSVISVNHPLVDLGQDYTISAL